MNNNYFKNIIIGSGPSSIVAANEMLKNQKDFLILDVGHEIEEKKKEIVNDYLDNKNITNFKNNINLLKKKLNKYPDPNLKFPFGSDFVFKLFKKENLEHEPNVNTLSSNAKGGLSNIWGTLCSPFYKKDIEEWDLLYNEYYQTKEEVLDLIPISSSDDNLNKFFDVRFGDSHTFEISKASKEVFNFLKKNESELNKKGFYYGRSKFAVSNKYSYKNTNCKECGLCHYGCPYDCMFNAKNLLSKLILNNSDRDFYKKNIFVNKFEKKNDIIILHTIDTISGISKEFSCTNLLIGCGPILTASLILRSKIIKTDTIKIKESQRFYFPAFYTGKTGNNLTELKNTLPELFFELFNENISSKSIHLQFYTFNDLMLKPFETFFGKFTKYLVKIFPFIFNRLTVIVGYIHSNYSSELIVKNDTCGKNNRLIISSKNNLKSKFVILKCVKFIKKLLKEKFFIIIKFVTLNSPGSSYHYGGSFPMSKFKINEKSTTLNGELYDFKNVFILDASVLPSIPGSPTTFNVAINSSRIIKNLIKDNRI